MKTENEDSVIFEIWNPRCSLPKLTFLLATSGLNFSVAVYNWFLPDNHAIYNDMKRSVKHTSISTIMSQLENYEICAGLNKSELRYSKCEDPSPTCILSSIIRLTIPLKPEHYEEDGPPF